MLFKKPTTKIITLQNTNPTKSLPQKQYPYKTLTHPQHPQLLPQPNTQTTPIPTHPTWPLQTTPAPTPLTGPQKNGSNFTPLRTPKKFGSKNPPCGASKNSGQKTLLAGHQKKRVEFRPLRIPQKNPHKYFHTTI